MVHIGHIVILTSAMCSTTGNILPIVQQVTSTAHSIGMEATGTLASMLAIHIAHTCTSDVLLSGFPIVEDTLGITMADAPGIMAVPSVPVTTNHHAITT